MASTFKHFAYTAAIVCLLTGCTTGQLYYTNAAGERKLACNVEFVGLPKVDIHAVDYALSFCAKTAVKQGHILDAEQQYLLTLDTQFPAPPCGVAWDHEIAKSAYDNRFLTAREYGYIVAHVDLGLAAVNHCQ
ncbi:hypothetical protein QTP81_17010 [Alteromonas sp. ASW11-36]|uniref:Lipoprotein n=1 Tax=Alteromonas arenosi TaxID=3055817 RepID=A0ABT7T1J1_9ALTE|nr:hypothetical protein [Alteromonas sp. ASW11-36]MDM7862310.1 hypothetical protein [Alteromonas sp. ASW11-36]